MRKSHIVLPPPSPLEETETMTATTMRMETKAMTVAAEARRPAWRRWRQLGESAALAAAASLAAEVAAW